jgi:hypothetical protein
VTFLLQLAKEIQINLAPVMEKKSYNKANTFMNLKFKIAILWNNPKKIGSYFCSDYDKHTVDMTV